MPRLTNKIIVYVLIYTKRGCISFYHKFCEIELIYTQNGDLITFKCAQTKILYVIGIIGIKVYIEFQTWLLLHKIHLIKRH